MCRRIKIVNLDEWEELIEKAKKEAPHISEVLDEIKNYEFEIRYIFADFTDKDGKPAEFSEKSTFDELRIHKTDEVDYKYHDLDYRDI